MEVVFLTLFLSVTTTGPQTVQVQAPQGTASVVFRLDGEQAAELTGPPWSVTVDFGEELVPHELEASAFDSEGKLLATARLAVNMPHGLADTFLAVETLPDGRRAARLRWESAVAREPHDIRLTWDGTLLEVADPSRFVLPRTEAGTAHILRAELDFGSRVTAMAEALVGSKDRDYSSAELSAVPVLLSDGEKRLDAADVGDALAARGRPLKAVAVEQGPADVVFVVDPGAETLLDGIAADGAAPGRVPHPEVMPGQTALQHSRFPIPKEILAYFVLSAPKTYTETGYNVYPAIGPLSRGDGGLLDLYRRVRGARSQRDESSFAVAAQLSGLRAIQNSRRRAVVWILGAGWQLSAPGLERARGFLRALNAPLFVWRVLAKDDPGGVAAGETPVATPRQLDKAVDELERAVSRQRLVWVEGRHLPQTITLSPDVKGLRIAR